MALTFQLLPMQTSVFLDCMENNTNMATEKLDSRCIQNNHGNSKDEATGITQCC